MQVGVNYPWVDYGWDFGAGPPDWNGGRTSPRWFDRLDADLERFRELGITVVRWFILADGLTYGTGPEAPFVDPSDDRVWRFEPPALPDDILQHFDEALRRFDLTRRGLTPPIQLIPVFVDFHFCYRGHPIAPPDPSWIKCGRVEAIASDAARAAFLDRALEPLLAVSRRWPEVIFAWEPMNEPDLITTGWHASRLVPRPVGPDAMRAFLGACSRRIRAAGFKTTIGFASIEGLRRSGITADVNQFHHYASGRRNLPPHTFDPRFPAIVGEFATAQSDVWPDLAGTGQRVIDRLRLLRERGYPLAMPWAFLSSDRHTSWTADVEADLRAFTA